MNHTVRTMAVFIEFLAASGLAIVFHMVLHNQSAALVTFGTGLLLSLATYLIREDVGQARAFLMEKYDQCHDLTFAVARITDSECQAKANEIMGALKKTLSLLQQGYIPLDETEFYLKSTIYMDRSCNHIRAVDPMTPGWESRGAVVNYFQANLRALARGIRITRVFVVNQADLEDTEVRKVLLSQHQQGIEVRIAFREEMPATTGLGGRDTVGSHDFAIYDGQVVTEVSNQPGKYFGRKTREAGLVRKYETLFDLVLHVSHTVTVDDGRVVLAVDPVR